MNLISTTKYLENSKSVEISNKVSCLGKLEFCNYLNINILRKHFFLAYNIHYVYFHTLI